MLREIIEGLKLKIEKLSDYAKEPTFIFIIGGTGSGKNYVYRKFLSNLKLVDTDKYIEEYAKEYGTDGRKQISRAVARSKRELLISFDKQESVVQVGTGLNHKSSENKFKWAKDAGMKVVVVLVDTPLKTAMKRNQDRAASGAQALVPDWKVEKSNSESRDNIKYYAKDKNVDTTIYYKN